MKQLIPVLILIVWSCAAPKNEAPATSIVDLADAYYARTLETFPQYSYFNDISIDDHSAYGSNDLESMAIWENFEDSLYTELQKLDASTFGNKADQITYWLLKEELESSIGMRVCKRNLWNVNHMSGIHQFLSRLADVQPVGTDELRQQAITRWKKIPDIIDIEIANLKQGVTQGYSMPVSIVEMVIEQLNTLTGYSLDESPFMAPANREEDESFKQEWSTLITEVIVPALDNYRKYLEDEYLANARESISILDIPNGSACYKAFIRSATTTNKSGEEIFQLGQEIVNKHKTEIEELGKELYATNNFEEIIQLIKGDSGNYFDTSEEILSYNQSIMDSARIICEDWFAMLPSKDVTIKPYLPHESGIGSYESARGDEPAYYRINLKNPSSQTIYSNETLSFHEAYPGHHLQIGIEQDIEGLHPIRKLIGFGSYVEGWARYSEQLSEEMGLYQNKASLISRRAWPSRGLVVDPGLHIYNWPKDSLINFMMESGMSEMVATSLYNRSIVWPSQLTSYDVGGEEIKALRKLAEEKLGDAFDIKQFHARVLENGSIPLSALRSVVEDWIAGELAK